jgi:hypothetical protein
MIVYFFRTRYASICSRAAVIAITIPGNGRAPSLPWGHYAQA